MKKLINLYNIIAISLFAVLFSAQRAIAQSIPIPAQPTGLPKLDVGNTINTVIQGIFAVGQVAFVIVLLIGGVMYITSAGNEDQAAKARKLMLNAVIGIVVLFAAYGVTTWIIGVLK